MGRGKQARKWVAGVSAAFVLAPVLGMSVPSAAPVVYAAELTVPPISKEQAIQLAKKWIAIPDTYRQEEATFQDAERDRYSSESMWHISWRTSKDDGGIYVTIDADTGELLQFSRYESLTQAEPTSEAISEEQALEKAEQFLQLVTSEDKRKKLSKPNQYIPLLPYYPGGTEHAVTFTRMENNLPYLENGFQVAVDRSGEVRSFSRQWNKGELPAPVNVLSGEQAEKLLAEKAAPSLLYKELSSITGSYESGRGKYVLVYDYAPTDAQYVDAQSGTVVNALGKQAASKGVQPLGTTVSAKAGSETRVTKEQAQLLAERLIQKLPGEYRSDGSRGGGVSSGPDGIESRNWNFEFTPIGEKGKAADPVQVSINDRGQLEEFSLNEAVRFRETGRKIEKAVPWKEAEESAVKLVKTLYADRLGELYLLDQRPSDAYIADALERGRQFEVRFGWLKDGVPVENTELSVEVNPQTGVAEAVRMRFNSLPDRLPDNAGKAIGIPAAKKAEQEHKTLMLTYFQPQAGGWDLPEAEAAPLLVYRYVGEQGVVDGESGEWISFEQEQKKQRPQDIADHPQQAALEFALRIGLMTAKDGKLEPDKQVTRGEMAQMMAQMTNRIEFHSHSFSSLDDEGTKPYPFTDVSPEHPQYGAIQKAFQDGLIAKEGAQFKPDQAITRAQAADMVARLLGYGDLLDKQGLFVSAYPDVAQKDVPAVALVHSLGVFPGGSASRFQPDEPLTRAEAAQLLQAVLLFKQSEE